MAQDAPTVRYKTKTSNVNLKQIVSNGIEVAQYLCRMYHKKKIIVLGHSWGSIVAVNMVKRRPDLFAAYVGTGQVACRAKRGGGGCLVRQCDRNPL